MSFSARLGAFAACALLLVLPAACGAQGGLPRFAEAFGIIDSPCVSATASDVVQHCTAHVLITNTGGEGVGHATLAVILKDAKGGTSTVKCGRSIPDLPGGGYVDLVCPFDLPPGSTVDPIPNVSSIDYGGAVSANSSGSSGIGTVVLAVATLLLAVATLIATTARRPIAASDLATSALSPRASTDSPRPSPVAAAIGRDDVDAEYDLPELPR